MMIAVVIALDVLLTLLACNLMGPAASKLGGVGLVGWAACVPFYLLRLYIGPAVLFAPSWAKWYTTGTLLGLALTRPLALWSTVPGCPAAEKWLNLASGGVQGLAVSYAVDRLVRRPLQTATAR